MTDGVYEPIIVKEKAMDRSDFLNYTASEPMTVLIEKLYGGESLKKEAPQTLTPEEARTDVLYLQYVFENAYSGYTYYDKAQFDRAFEKMLLGVDLAGEISPVQLLELIAAQLDFITDGHLSMRSGDLRKGFYRIEQTWVAELLLIGKDGAFFDAASGRKVDFKEPVRAFPTVSEGNENAFLLGVRSKEPITDIPVTLGEKAVRLAVHKIRSAEGTCEILHEERYDGDTAIVSCSDFGSNSREEQDAFYEIGMKCRGYSHVVWDLTNNSGGNSVYAEKFLTGLTGGVCTNQLTCSILESTLVGAKLTGEISEVDRHFVDEVSEEEKYESIFPGRLHVIMNDRVASSGEMAVAYARMVPGVTFYGCNTMGVGRYGDVLIYYLPNSKILLMCPYKVFDIGARETIGFEPDYWIDSDDVLAAVLKKLKGEGRK